MKTFLLLIFMFILSGCVGKLLSDWLLRKHLMFNKLLTWYVGRDGEPMLLVFWDGRCFLGKDLTWTTYPEAERVTDRTASIELFLIWKKVLLKAAEERDA
jgi:hypothetical protein